MRNIIRYICLFSFMSCVLWLTPTNGWAQNDSIFIKQTLTAIEEAVDDAIEGWMEDDEQKLRTALGKLTLNETYLLAVGKSSESGRSYLSTMPKSLTQNFCAAAAYLYLLRCERRGILLRPISRFEGKRFQYTQTRRD